MRQYGESKTTRIMMATLPHVTSGSGLRKFQADGFFFDRVYKEFSQLNAYFITYPTLSSELYCAGNLLQTGCKIRITFLIGVDLSMG